jgi:hypothetical protein
MLIVFMSSTVSGCNLQKEKYKERLVQIIEESPIMTCVRAKFCPINQTDDEYEEVS